MTSSKSTSKATTSQAPTKPPKQSWGQAFAVYRHPPVVAMLFLGFAAGLPFLLVFSTLSAWLTEVDVSRATIGYFSWVGVTYSIKFFWAPVVDRLPIPVLTRLFGRRRSWMLLAQTGIAAGIIGMAQCDPRTELAAVAGFALLVAFSSATQDISIDAWRIEAAKLELQGAMAATYQAGYRIALLVTGAGAFYLATGMSWQQVYLWMAVLVAIGMATVLIIHEPESQNSRETLMREQRVVSFLERSEHLPNFLRNAMAWFIGAVVCPFVDFFARNGIGAALVILAFVGVFRVSDITMGVMANPFYLDMGYSKAEIASVAKIFGIGMTIAGAAIGGIMVARFGVMKPLLLGAVLVASTNLLFATLSLMDPDLMWLAVVISADNLSGGIAGSAFIAYLSSLTNTAYTATQYALFTSIMTLPGKFLGGFAGVVVEGFGYFTFFVYAAAIGIPAILLVLYLMRRLNVDNNSALLSEDNHA